MESECIDDHVQKQFFLAIRDVIGRSVSTRK